MGRWLYLQHVLGAAVAQLGIPVGADCIRDGLHQALRGAVVHQGVAALVCSFCHDLHKNGVITALLQHVSGLTVRRPKLKEQAAAV